MDPNSGKKDMFNKLGRDQLLKNLEEENFSRKTISFYRYVIIDKPETMRDRLYVDWKKLNVFGRIYLAKEGINAQLSLPEENWSKFIEQLNTYLEFQDISFKTAVEDNGKSFFKLTIKVRNQIVADGLSIKDYDVTNVGKHLTAKEWNKAMENGAVVVDMRNHYESEIGRFQGAICPDVETFREELPLVKKILKGKEEEKILLYCTGGIRCEKTSAYLKHHGFNNVNQLEGGIIDYHRQLDKDTKIKNYFMGKNFVFDERRAERISKTIISKCHQCNTECDSHVNCMNVNCNLLFIQCNDCKNKYKSCCSLDCIDVIKYSPEKQKLLRKGKDNQKKYYSHRKVKLKLKND